MLTESRFSDQQWALDRLANQSKTSIPNKARLELLVQEICKGPDLCRQILAVHVRYINW